MKNIIIFFSLLFLLFAGCAEKNNSQEKNNAAENYEIKVIEEEGLQEIINSRKGKILFVNVWATWCVPCIEEFPDIVRLSEDYEKNGVDFLSLSADFSSEIDSKIIPFLKEQNVSFPVYVINDQKSETIIRMLSKEWSGALPATFIYDKNGKQQKFLLGLQDYKSFKNNVDSVLSL